MRRQFIIILFALAISFSVKAQEKRALLIAVDHYEPPADYIPAANTAGRAKFYNLEGCINDALSMESVVVSRFQFSPAKVDTLFNDAATRDHVLGKMNELLTKSASGDIAFIYYAGHGSQVTNTLSREGDKKDETMVPCDTWKEGVQDIRDKELATIFNKFIDKGVKLTVIFDCCHSGSLSRGPQEPGKFRYMPEANYDAKDASQPVAPETRPEGTFMIMSAAQDNEFAQEQIDDNNMPHGAFTIAFLQALEQQSVNASAFNLFTSIRAILKSNGKKQEPVLGGSEDRKQQTLFGIAKGTLPDKSLVAVSGFENNKVILQGGFALGLYKENELCKLNGRDTLVKLRIDSVVGVNRSVASFIKGTVKDLKAGELLEVTNWVSSSAPLLKVFIPPTTMSYDEVMKLAAINKELKMSKKIHWVENLEKTDPYTTIYYDGHKYHANVDGKEVPVPATLTAAAILQLCKQDSSLYFELPASKELATAVRNKLKTNKSMVIVNSAGEANYVLYGTINDQGKPSYGLRRAQTSARDSLESMMVQTRAFPVESPVDASYNFVADSVYEYAMRLSKIRGWLQLSPPKDANKNFPFHLELVNTGTNQAVTSHEYKIGDKIAFHLVADKGYTGANGIKRYVYVFLIDKDGTMTLGYPAPEDGNVANQFPKFDNNRNLVEDVSLFEGEVSLPVGTDNYFLLASDEPITNYTAVFTQAGVRGATRDPNPLGNLLNLGNDGGTRGFTKSVSNWSLIKMAMKSRL